MPFLENEISIKIYCSEEKSDRKKYRKSNRHIIKHDKYTITIATRNTVSKIKKKYIRMYKK